MVEGVLAVNLLLRKGSMMMSAVQWMPSRDRLWLGGG